MTSPQPTEPPDESSRPFPGDRPLRVVIASTEKGWRGGEQQAAILARGLRDAGLDCQLVARHGSPFHERMWDEGFEGITVRGRGKSPRQWLAARRWLKERPADVCFWNDPHAMTSLGSAMVGLSAGRLAARRTSFRLKSPLPYRLFADRIVCVSQSVAEQCIADGIPPTMTAVVYDGVPPVPRMDRGTAKFQLALQPDECVVTCVAALTEEKNHTTLIDAWQNVPRTINGRPTTLLFAGDGSCRDALQQQIRQSGQTDRVRLLGHRDDIPRILSASDLFVMPSVREGLCTAAIQAMMAGCRMLLAHTGGLPELLSTLSGPQGQTVKAPRDASSWTHQITELLATERDCDHRPIVARGNYFSAERMVQETRTLMEALRPSRRRRVA